MNPVTVKRASSAIVYDADLDTAPEPEWFDPDYWRDRGSDAGSAPGRGSTLFIDAPFGAAALRRYLRGGWVARFSEERYWFNGYGLSRPFIEFDLLRRAREAGLRVPAPVAALCERDGPFYLGAIITRRVADATPLADRLADPELDWSRVGAELREFHDRGLEHADLNARNILLEDASHSLWVLDLDRSFFNEDGARTGPAQLRRLRRSLGKLWPARAPALSPCWDRLLEGYGD